MRKIKSSIVFKSYSQQQGLLLPPSLEELIGDDHLVKVVNEVVEQMDLADLINIKHNMSFRRFHLRGLKKVNTEFTLIAMAHNLRKVHIKRQKQAA